LELDLGLYQLSIQSLSLRKPVQKKIAPGYTAGKPLKSAIIYIGNSIK
jgi:hypothetical protein